MATIVTRSGKGSALTFDEMDANFTNLNNELANVSLGVLPADSVSSTEIDDSDDFTMNTVTTTAGIEVGGSILPTANNAVDLGSPTKMFRDLYLGPDSLYVNGVKILQSNAASMQFTTDASSNQEIFFQPDGDFRMASTQGDVIVAATNTLRADTIKGTAGDAIPQNLIATSFQSVGTSGMKLESAKLSKPSGNMEIETATGGTEYIHLETNDVYMGTFASAVRVSDGTVTTAAGDLNLKSVDGNVVIAVDANDKDIELKIKDGGGTLQQAAHFNTYSYLEAATDADAGTNATNYKPILDVPYAIRIGDNTSNFTSNGQSGDNINGAFNQNGVLITNGDNKFWPTLSIVSYGGANPLVNQLGPTAFGGVAENYPTASLQLAGASGTKSSPSAMESGDRLGQVAFTGYDGSNFGGQSAIASASITVVANEAFSTTGAGAGRGAKMEFDILPTGETDPNNADSTSNRAHQLTITGDTVQIGNENIDDKYVTMDSGAGELDFTDTVIKLGEVGSAPSTASDHGFIYAKDNSGTADIYVKDGAGNETLISPHNEAGEWEYYSVNKSTGKTVRINMEKMIRKLEQITGESFIENE